MLKNYLRVAIKNLISNRTYSIISVVSLSSGMAICILLLMYVLHEFSYDKYHYNAENIYRLCYADHPYSAPGAAKYLSENIPEIEQHIRLLPRDDMTFNHGENKFKENGMTYADPEVFSLFTFNFLDGEPETALTQPATIVITDKIARKYFGDENPMGKILTIDNEYDCTITGIIEDMPLNSHFRYDFFVTLVNGNELFGDDWMQSWGWLNFLAYFQMQEGFDKPAVEEKICELMKDPTDPEADVPHMSLQKLTDIHLYSSHFDNDIQPQNSIVYVLILSGIGLLILFIACFNYINLLSANATTRSTEIGVRKVFGSSVKQMAMRFVTESVLVLIISLFVSVLLLRLLLPEFNDMTGKVLSLSSLLNLHTLLGIAVILIITVILAVWYPAFFLPTMQASKVMEKGRSKFWFRKFLVGFQFTIVILLTACAIVMFRQISFMKNKELGFDKDYVIVSEVDDFGSNEKYNTLKEELLGMSEVVNVSQASRVPSYDLSDYGVVKLTEESEKVVVPYVHVNYDFFRTLGVDAKLGRLFSRDLKSDIDEAIILNQAAVEKIGITGNPIGQTLKCNWPPSERKIIGVTEDFHFESLYEKIVPAVFVIHPDRCWNLMVKIAPSDLNTSITRITEICRNRYPGQIFNFYFLDDRFNSIYYKEKATLKLLQYFAGLAVFLACIGLFGMASFIMVNRTKEIGIRKVNGAGISEIVQLLNRNFVIWVGFSFIIATPIAWYSMNIWLRNFAYKTSLSWWIFGLSGVFTLVVVLLTISWLSYGVARKNPVDSLRYE